MCGICGRLSWDPPPDRGAIERMSARMERRGPDASGCHIDGPVGLGHRRLSVIDISDIANQPLFDHTGRFSIVFNGEIYNYVELRDELIKAGASFRTAADTEVILESYKKWGTQCVERFNGMFAFALWDSPERKLFLARDRLGKKPLYFRRLNDGGIVFASELKSLVEDPDVPRKLNMRAVSHFLSLNYTLTSECALEDVEKLEAAHFLIAERGREHRPVRYWNLADSFRNKRVFASEGEAGEALSELLTDAIRLRLVSDVPLGAFLSGGVDSSAIVAGMCRLRRPDSNRTFSIGFREKTYSELSEAGSISDFLGVSHSSKIVEPEMALELPRIAYYADEPFADTSIIPMYFLSQFARNDVTVALSGDGGDEIFAGYETYAADRIHHATQFIPASIVRAISRGADAFIPSSRDKVSADYKLKHFLRGHSLPPDQAHYFWRTIFSDDEKKRLLRGDARSALDAASPFDQFSKYQREVSDCHYLDQAMYVDIKTWLVDDILVKLDRSTMAHSLEARAPLLDYRLVEFAASLPVNMKMKGFQKKYIFKLSQRPYLPAETLALKKKGFNAPVSHWIDSSLGGLLAELLDDINSADGMLNRDMVDSLWEEHRARRRDNSLKLFSVIMLILWLKQYRFL